jgi:hypothetical protein
MGGSFALAQAEMEHLADGPVTERVALPSTWPSDKRYKQDITPLPNALDRTLRMRGVLYRWNTDKMPNQPHPELYEVGVLAQDVEAVYPELVTTWPDGFKSVDYTRLAPILIEALREEHALVLALQTQLARQQDSLQAVRGQMASLRNDFEKQSQQVLSQQGQINQQTLDIQSQSLMLHDAMNWLLELERQLKAIPTTLGQAKN